ncbi:hypothetical protein ACRTDU_04495 [Sunxiuqinia elliptica]
MAKTKLVCPSVEKIQLFVMQGIVFVQTVYVTEEEENESTVSYRAADFLDYYVGSNLVDAYRKAVTLPEGQSVDVHRPF